MRAGWWAAAAVACATAMASAETQRYEVRVEAQELEVDTRGTVALVVAPQNGFAIDPDFPATFQFVPEVGDEVLVAAPSEQDKDDARFDDGLLRWEVGVTARRVGRHPARIRAKFRVCNGDDCTIGTSDLRLTIVVKGS